MKHRNFKNAIVLAFVFLIGCKDAPQQDDHPDLIIFKRDQIKEIERISFDDTEFIDSCIFTTG